MLEARTTKKGRRDRFAQRWDRRPKFRPPPYKGFTEWNRGDIGEDADGVWLLRHPEALLAEEPELAEVLTLWWSTTERGVRLGEAEGRSAWFGDVWLTLLAVVAREEAARIEAAKKKGPKGGKGGGNGG